MTRPATQTSLDCAAPDPAGLAQLKANQPLRPARPQEPCDVGLFSDAPAQIDLVDYINQTARR